MWLQSESECARKHFGPLRIVPRNTSRLSSLVSARALGVWIGAASRDTKGWMRHRGGWVSGEKGGTTYRGDRTCCVSNQEQAAAIRNNDFPSTHLTSSVSVSSPLVQTTDSFSDSSTSLASHLSLRTLPALRCLSLDTIRPESSLIVRAGAATRIQTRVHNPAGSRSSFGFFSNGEK